MSPMTPVNLRATAGAPHRSLGLLSPASASCGHSWKMWEIVSWPSPHNLQTGSTSGRRLFSYERRARWYPHRRRARWTRSCQRRSASSELTGGRASPRRVLGGSLAKALATNFWCSQEPSEFPNGRHGTQRRVVWARCCMYVPLCTYWVVKPFV